MPCKNLLVSKYGWRLGHSDSQVCNARLVHYGCSIKIAGFVARLRHMRYSVLPYTHKSDICTHNALVNTSKHSRKETVASLASIDSKTVPIDRHQNI